MEKGKRKKEKVTSPADVAQRLEHGAFLFFRFLFAHLTLVQKCYVDYVSVVTQEKQSCLRDYK
jgi:hypothetical protein